MGCSPRRPVAPEVTKFLQLKLRNEGRRSSVPIVRTAGRHWPAAVRSPSGGSIGLTCSEQAALAAHLPSRFLIFEGGLSSPCICCPFAQGGVCTYGSGGLLGGGCICYILIGTSSVVPRSDSATCSSTNCSVLPAALLAPLPSSASALVRACGVPCMRAPGRSTPLLGSFFALADFRLGN